MIVSRHVDYCLDVCRYLDVCEDNLILFDQQFLANAAPSVHTIIDSMQFCFLNLQVRFEDVADIKRNIILQLHSIPKEEF